MSPPPSDRTLLHVRFGVFGVVSTTRPADINPCFGCQQGRLLDRLQSIFNAAGRLVFSARRSERITPLFRDLHWLRVPERIQFCLCVLAFRCLNGSAPPYLAESVRRTAYVEGRRHLRSSTTMTLVVPSVQRLSLGDRAFPVAASRAWNWLEQPTTCHPNCFILHLLSATTEDTSI